MSGDTPGTFLSRGIGAVAAVVAATGSSIALGFPLAAILPPAYVVLVFLVGVLAVAVVSGLWAGVAAAFASFFAFNFFFVEPTWTFAVADPREVFALVAFLLVAVMTGGLAGRLREEADAARRRADMLTLLHDFAERVAVTDDVATIRSLVARRVAEQVHGSAVLIERRDAAAGICEAWPETPDFTTDERRAIERVFATGRPAPAVAPGYAERRFEFRPLATAHGIVAVVGLAPASGTRRVGADDEAGLSALLDHAATALERARFSEETSAAQAAVEQERLRSALLSSISHDLRTPLAAILGSVTSLRQLGDRMAPDDRDDLLAAIEEETDRLSRFVADLLAMTRLEAGLDVRRDWIDVGDIVRAAADHLRRVHPAHPVTVETTAPLPPVRADAALLEQVLFNLGDNAAKASPPAQPIRFEATRCAAEIVLAVVDRGRGLSAEEIDRLFVRPAPTQAALSPQTRGGLGLAIARRVVGAMGGTLEAVHPADLGRGARVEVRLPVEAVPIPDDQEVPEP